MKRHAETRSRGERRRDVPETGQVAVSQLIREGERTDKGGKNTMARHQPKVLAKKTSIKGEGQLKGGQFHGSGCSVGKKRPGVFGGAA